MNLKLIIIILCVVSAMTTVAKPYEVLLNTEPAGSDAYLYLVHPFNVPGNTNYGTDHYYFDCEPSIPDPDWGVKGWDGDDPRLKGNYSYGARKIEADTLNDPGDCWVKVAYLGAGSALCTVTVSNWPGMQPMTFTKNMGVGDEPWYVTNLPCAHDIGLKIIKAKQNRLTGRLKIGATFKCLLPMSETSTYLRTSLDSSETYSLRVEEWMHYTTDKQVKIRKEGTVGKFGKPVRGIVKTTPINRMALKGQGNNSYQNRPLRVFVAFGGCSGFQQIYMDKRSRYLIDE
ncbi:hypothetical protein KAH27_08540 [bacterium]|nr:hypothetical protein [bacterium]